MATPLVSVLVPIYNDAAYLEEALGSLSSQTLDDLEVVLADDGSTDRSPEIADIWSKRDPRFRRVESREHVGMTRNWNRALRGARGKYVAKLDADDVAQPRFLEILSATLEDDARVGAVFCRTLDCDADLSAGKPYVGEAAFERHGIDPAESHVLPGIRWFAISFEGYQLWHSNAQMYRREVLERLGGWDERWWCSDTDLLLRVLDEDGLIAHRPYCGIWYRRRQGSMNDVLERAGWKSPEHALIHLRSLARHRQSGRPMNRPLWRAWRRYWATWLDFLERTDGAPDALPPNLRLETISSLTASVRPPWCVRARYRAGRMIRRAVG